MPFLFLFFGVIILLSACSGGLSTEISEHSKDTIKVAFTSKENELSPIDSHAIDSFARLFVTYQDTISKELLGDFYISLKEDSMPYIEYGIAKLKEKNSFILVVVKDGFGSIADLYHFVQKQSVWKLKQITESYKRGGINIESIKENKKESLIWLPSEGMHGSPGETYLLTFFKIVEDSLYCVLRVPYKSDWDNEHEENSVVYGLEGNLTKIEKNSLIFFFEYGAYNWDNEWVFKDSDKVKFVFDADKKEYQPDFSFSKKLNEDKFDLFSFDHRGGNFLKIFSTEIAAIKRGKNSKSKTLIKEIEESWAKEE